MLLNYPIEIRRAIYAHLIDVPGIHIVRTENGDFTLHACVGPDLYAGNNGCERKPTDDPRASDPIWGRRVASSWGPHWECEEVALYMKQEAEDEYFHDRAVGLDNGAILRVCKQVYFEFMELMMELITFYVTDLQTLDTILGVEVTPPASPPISLPLDFKHAFLPNVTKLDITLLLPEEFFFALEEPNKLIQDSNSPVLDGELKIWSGLSKRISKLKALRGLHVWLDHTDKSYWAVVNERAVLSQFEPLTSNFHLDIFFGLPFLHPTLENSQRHQVTDENAIDSSLTSSTPFKIRRFVRQKHQSKKLSDDYYSTWYRQDFPHSVGHPITRGWSLARIEEWERDMWLSGEDVKYLLSLMVIE